MKKVKLTEADLTRIVKRVMNEGSADYSSTAEDLINDIMSNLDNNNFIKVYKHFLTDKNYKSNSNEFNISSRVSNSMRKYENMSESDKDLIEELKPTLLSLLSNAEKINLKKNRFIGDRERAERQKSWDDLVASQGR